MTRHLSAIAAALCATLLNPTASQSNYVDLAQFSGYENCYGGYSRANAAHSSPRIAALYRGRALSRRGRGLNTSRDVRWAA